MDKLERVAQALCKLDGLDPDEPVDTGIRNNRGFLGMVAVMEPRWHRYEEEAIRFVTAFEAMAEAGTITSGG